jgi:hypothetical protein
MRKLLKIIVLTFYSILLTSCWIPCSPAINGTIKDKNINTLLDSVKVDVYEGNDLTYTLYSDSLGRFLANAKSKSNFMFKDCESGFKLIFSKQGYKEQSYIGVAPAMNIEIHLEQ